jgi:FG-GAP repeat
MNGATPFNESVISGNPGPSWRIIGAGDYNGDGKSDIVWQNDSGQAAIWLINGTTPVSEVLAGGNPGPSWHIHAAS